MSYATSSGFLYPPLPDRLNEKLHRVITTLKLAETSMDGFRGPPDLDLRWFAMPSAEPFSVYSVVVSAN